MIILVQGDTILTQDEFHMTHCVFKKHMNLTTTNFGMGATLVFSHLKNLRYYKASPS